VPSATTETRIVPQTFWSKVRNATRLLPKKQETRGALDNLAGVSDFGQPQSWLLNFLGLPSKSGAAVSHTTAMNIPTVYACVNILSEAMATIPLRLYRKTANGREEATDLDLYDLMVTSPDGFRTAFEWRRFMQACLSWRGNAYSRIYRNTYGEPERIIPLNPEFVSIWPQADGTALYRYKSENIPFTDIVHLKGLSTNGWIGHSPITLMREALGLALTTEEHASRHFANGATPGGLLVVPKNLTSQQLEELEAQWDTKHRGVGSVNRPMIASGGLDWKQIGLSNEDSQFLASREFQVDEIAMGFRVPVVLIRNTSKASSWGTGIETITQGFVKFTLAPLARSWEQSLDLSLLTYAQRKAGYYFSFDFRSLMRGDAKTRAAFYQTMRNIGAMSVNEIRAEEHFNDLPDNIGDDYRLPFNGTGGAVAAQPAIAKGDEVEAGDDES